MEEARRQTWSAEEDELLAQLVKRKGAKDWSSIAPFFKSRNGKRCGRRGGGGAEGAPSESALRRLQLL